MRRIALVACFCLSAGPAMAAWQWDDLSNDDGLAYRTWSQAVGSTVELEIYCDDWSPGVLELVLYTGDPSRPIDLDDTALPMQVRVDDDQSMTVSVFRDEMNGEELFFTSNIDIDNLGDLLLMMAQAEQSIEIAFQGQQHRFGTEELFETLVDLTEICP